MPPRAPTPRTPPARRRTSRRVFRPVAERTISSTSRGSGSVRLAKRSRRSGSVIGGSFELVIGCGEGAQAGQGPGAGGLHGADRNAQLGARVGLGEVFEEAQHHDGPLLGGQTGEQVAHPEVLVDPGVMGRDRGSSGLLVAEGDSVNRRRRWRSMVRFPSTVLVHAIGSGLSSLRQCSQMRSRASCTRSSARPWSGVRVRAISRRRPDGCARSARTRPRREVTWAAPAGGGDRTPLNTSVGPARFGQTLQK